MKTKEIVKHTPGPWVVREGGLVMPKSAVDRGFQDYICQMPYGSAAEGKEMPQAVADAYLIAAAPVMLKGFYELRDRLQMGQDASGNSSINEAEIRLINSLIDKAEGR